VAQNAGFSGLSLSVDDGNRAIRLYERLGYREVSRDEGGVRMSLDPRQTGRPVGRPRSDPHQRPGRHMSGAP
jgi:hypothetical protein